MKRSADSGADISSLQKKRKKDAVSHTMSSNLCDSSVDRKEDDTLEAVVSQPAVADHVLDEEVEVLPNDVLVTIKYLKLQFPKTLIEAGVSLFLLF